MAPSGVNDTMRAMMGATKRFWDRINGVVTVSAVGNAYTYTVTVPATSLVSGEIYTFRVATPNTGAATLNVGVGGNLPLVKSAAPDGSGTKSLTSSDLILGGYYQAAWDSVSSQFVLLNPAVDMGQVGDALRSTSTVLKADLSSVSAVLSAAIGAGGAGADAAIRSTSLVIKTDISSVSADIIASLLSTSAVIKADISSVSFVITTAFIDADRSLSSALKSEIASLSGVATLSLRSVSIELKTDISSISSAITTAYAASDRSTSAAIKTATDLDIASVFTTPVYRGTGAAVVAGTAITLAGINTWANELVVSYDRVAMDAGGGYIVRLGGSTGVQSTDYFGNWADGGGSTGTHSNGAIVTVTTALRSYVGYIKFVRLTGNIWSFLGLSSTSDNASNQTYASGLVSLTSQLTSVAIFSSGGSFSSGTFRAVWTP